MGIETLTLLMVGLLLVLMVAGVPLAFVTGTVAIVFAIALYGPAVLPVIASRVYSFVGVYALVAVPMFVLMASILERTGVARDLFDAMYVFGGSLPGSLAVQTLLVALLMATMSGIIGGEIVLLGLVALPQMLRLKYDRKLAIGTICAGGSLGTMIPPSIVLIFFGLTAGVSIADLFLATVLPGLLLAGLYLAYILIRCTLNPGLAPPAPAQMLTRAEKGKLIKGLVLPLAVAGLVLGSIYTGIASVSESAGMGVVGALFAAWVRRELNWPMLRGALHQTMMTSGTILWLTFGATALIGVYNLMGGIGFITRLIGGLDYSPTVIVLVMMAILIVLGLFLDWIGILILTMPIFVPIITRMGYDPIWFGILFCMNMQISYLSPPFGPAAFYLKGVAPDDITLWDIYAALWPFMLLQAAAILLVIAFPAIALWLPAVLAN